MIFQFYFPIPLIEVGGIIIVFLIIILARCPPFLLGLDEGLISPLLDIRRSILLFHLDHLLRGVVFASFIQRASNLC